MAWRKVFVLLLLAVVTSGPLQAQEMSADEVQRERDRMSFMLGSWRIDARIRNSPTSFIEGSGTMNVSLREGNATIDALLDVQFPTFQVQGTTVRNFNPSTERWEIDWLDRRGPDVMGIEGRFANGRFVEFDFGTDNNGPYVGRLVIFNITENSFSVRKDRLYDDGSLMKDIWVYDATRTD